MTISDTSLGESTIEFAHESEEWKWIGIAAMSLVIAAAYFPVFNELRYAWRNPQYSHGGLIPVIAAVLLWLRRQPLPKITISQILVGGGIILFATLLRWIGTEIAFRTLERTTMIPCLIGVFVMFGGYRTLIWAGPPILFLGFMYPLPMIIEHKILNPLQEVAATSSCFLLQLFGMQEVSSQGFMLFVRGQELAVKDECSGLRMLTIFMAFAMAFAMIATNRPLWERIVLFLSSVPIALFVNIFRITLTGYLFALGVSSTIVHNLFHDMAGFIMMPMAIGLLYIEYQFLSHLIVDKPAESFVPAGGFQKTEQPDTPQEETQAE